MVSKLSKHLRVKKDDSDEMQDVEESTLEESQEIDPRWNELKKILDNN